MAEPVFKEINISNFSAQLRKDRFPDPEEFFVRSTASHILENADWIEIEGATVETYRGPPHIAKWRLNLAALSQKYNLYFVASRDQIHCYVPRDLKQTLPSSPDIIMELPESDMALTVGGHIDRHHPHSINHMIVGNLGDQEILLMACDDGDVFAFYTHHFQYEATRLDASTKVRYIEPILHQNVGDSAWGLAIHQRSRLIAVSSNLGEISIFVLAYTDEVSDGEMTEDERPSSLRENEKLQLLDSLAPVSTAFLQRKRSRKQVLSLGTPVNNIPTISFLNGADEGIEWIMAADIAGVAWLINPWDGSRTAIPGYHSHGDPMAVDFMSWGIIPLSVEHFKLTSTIHEALGFNIDDDNKKTILLRDSRETYLNVAPPRKRTIQLARHGYLRKPSPKFDTVENSRSTENRSPIRSTDDIRAYNFGTTPFNAKENTNLIWVLLRLPQSMRNEVASWQSLIHRTSTINRLGREGIFPVMMRAKPQVESGHPDPLIFLRTYAHDIELVTHTASNEKKVNTRLVDPLGESRGHGPERLNMLFPIPELNIIVVGSQSGKVCLLTLTKLEDPKGILPPFISFRLDHILPFMQHRSFRPACPLLGLAVSPLPKSGASVVKGISRRWRLILHYYDHTILSYDLGRNEDGLFVF